MISIRCWIISVFIFFTVICGSAQQGLELGGWIGASYYFGDLNTSYDLAHPGPGAGIIIRQNLNDRLAVKFSANYGFIRADDAWSDNSFERDRNINFKSHIGDLSAQFEFNFFRYIHGSDENNYTPYLFTGASLFYFNPYAVYNGEKTLSLRDLGTEGQMPGEEYSTIDKAINFGMGLKFDLNSKWSMNLELSMRKLFTDYLDDVSTEYPNENDIRSARPENTEIALLASNPALPGADRNLFGVEGRQRGNARDNDSYNFVSVGIVYYISKIRCPKLK